MEPCTLTDDEGCLEISVCSLLGWNMICMCRGGSIVSTMCYVHDATLCTSIVVVLCQVL